MGCPVVVVTDTMPDGWPRDDAPFTFVTDGVESAVAQAKAHRGRDALELPGATPRCRRCRDQRCRRLEIVSS